MSRGIWEDRSSRKINEDDSAKTEKYVYATYGRKRLVSFEEVRFELFLKK